MRKLIRGFDAFLSRVYGIYVFCREPDCMIRLQLAKAPHMLRFSSRMVRPGEPVLAIHLWNEHVPELPVLGPSLTWAARTQHRFVKSLYAVGGEFTRDPRLAHIRAVGGVTALFAPGERSAGARVMQHLGFTVEPYRCRLGAFGEFWENFHAWWIMWAYNPISLRRKHLIRLQRTEFWMTREEFLARYGPDATPKEKAYAGRFQR